MMEAKLPTYLTVIQYKDALHAADYVGKREDGSVVVAFVSRLSDNVSELACFSTGGRDHRFAPDVTCRFAADADLDAVADGLGLRRNMQKMRDISFRDCGIDVWGVRDAADSVEERLDVLRDCVDGLAGMTRDEDAPIIQTASAYALLHRAMRAREALSAIDAEIEALQGALSDGIDHVSECARRRERGERRAKPADAWLIKAASDVSERVGEPFDRPTVGECEDFIDEFRKRAGAPYTIGTSHRQWGYITAICDALGMRRPSVYSEAEASAFISQYEGAYKKARAEKKKHDRKEK